MKRKYQNQTPNSPAVGDGPENCPHVVPECHKKAEIGVNSPSGANKLPKRSKSALSFAPVPLVHEFDVNSPSTRRLEVKSMRADKWTNDMVYKELLLRGAKVAGGPDKISNDQRHLLRTLISHEVREYLDVHGVDSYGSLSVLKSKKKLLDILIRRTRVRTIYKGSRILPVDMTTESIVDELKRWNVHIESIQQKLDFSSENAKDFKKYNRRTIVGALEENLLKEASGLRIPGYDFGKTLVTAADVIEYQFCKENNDESTEMEYSEFMRQSKEIELSLKRKFRVIFLDVLKMELDLRSVDYSCQTESFSPRKLFSIVSSLSDTEDKKQETEIKRLFSLLFDCWQLEEDDTEPKEAVVSKLQQVVIDSDDDSLSESYETVSES